MGIIKREIVYSGDTLNTAARIVALCNSLGETLLVSEELLKEIVTEKYVVIKIGERGLRGREAKISLYGIRKRTDVTLIINGKL